MAASTILTITVALHGESPQTALERYIGGKNDSRHAALEKLRLLLSKLEAGQAIGKVHMFSDQADGTQATGSIACTQASAVDGTDTVVIGDVTLSVVASPSSDPGLGQFAKGASDTAMGDNLAAAINAHPRLKGVVTAANVAGTVTLTAVDKGTHGNLIVMTETGNSMVLTQMASGAKGTVKAKYRGYRFGI